MDAYNGEQEEEEFSSSKDADLSIGGGPNNFDTLKTLNIAKELILKES